MKRLVLFLVSILLFAISDYSQNIDTQKLPQQWTLQDCINYAIRNNIQLSSLRLNSSSARLDLAQSRNNQLPVVSGSASQSLANSNNVNASSNYGVSSSIVLYNGGYLKNSIKASELSVQSANLSVAETANDITLSITQAYLNILLSKENIKSLQELLTTSQAQLKQGQLRFDAGSISRKDFLQFESQLAIDNYNLVNANNSYRSNITTLKQLLQLPFSYEMVVAVPENLEPKEAVLTLDNAQMAAIAYRPEIKNKDVGIRLAQVELEKVRASGLPTVNLGAGLSSAFSSNQSSKYFGQLGDNFYQSIGVNASFPIFSRKLVRTNIAKSKIVIEQAKLDLEDTRTLLNQKVEQAYINLLNAQAQYEAATIRLRVAEETYQITNEQLRLGAITMLEVLLQKDLYIQALQAYIQAKYTAVLYNRIYRFYAGEPISF
jgi:outer membrane protein